jgi:NADH-quinone oxidoreductase subunit N
MNMDFVTPDFIPVLPEIFLLIMACAVLIVDVLLADENRYITYVLSLASLAGAAFITYLTAVPEPAYTFSNMFVDDPMSDVLKLVIFTTVALTLVYGKSYIGERGMFRGEFFVLALFATLGMMVMVSAGHFLTLYLGLELLSLSLYSMVALHRDNSVASEAAMKYFVLGALASGMLLYGMSMLYGVTGSLDIGEVAQIIDSGVSRPTVLAFGLVFIVAGLGFKLGAVPFHMWIPDVYHGAPTAVTLFIGTAPKVAAFAFVLRLLVEGLQGAIGDWQNMLIVMAVLSLAIGNVTAIAQSNLKRMLAYSAISHMGFLLLGILSGSLAGYSAAMFYVVVYALMSLAGFGMILLLSRQGFESEELDDLKGLNARHPWYAFVMLLIMFSMAGIPPTVGFYAKLLILQALVGADLIWLAVVAVLFALIGAYYYLRIVKLMYFDAPKDEQTVRAEGDIRILLSANGAAILLLGILPQPLISLCVTAIRQSLL